MNRMRKWALLVFALSCGLAHAADKKVLHCQVTAVLRPDAGSERERAVSAKLLIDDPPASGSIAILEVLSDPAYLMLKVETEELPGEAVAGLGLRTIYLFQPDTNVASGQVLNLQLQEPLLGNHQRAIPASYVIQDAFGRAGTGLRAVFMTGVHAGASPSEVEVYSVELDQSGRFPVYYPQTTFAAMPYEARLELEKRRREESTLALMERLREKLLAEKPPQATTAAREQIMCRSGLPLSPEDWKKDRDQRLKDLDELIARFKAADEQQLQRSRQHIETYQQSQQTRLVDGGAFSVRLTHPENGMSQSLPVVPFRHTGGNMQQLESIQSALLPASGQVDAEFQGNIFSGQFVDGDGAPVFPALVLHELQLPGQGTRYPQHFPILKVPPDGRFSFALPEDFLVENTGAPLLPASGGVNMRCVFPGPAGTAVLHRNLKSGQFQTVSLALPYSEMLTFHFQNSDGTTAATSLRPGYSTGLQLERQEKKDEGGNVLSWNDRRQHVQARVLDNGHISAGPVPLPGTYEVEFEGRTYGPLRLEQGASQSLVIWTVDAEQVVYRGRVVDIRSDQPVSGAFLFVGGHNDGYWNVSNLSESEQAELWKPVPAGKSVPPSGGLANRLGLVVLGKSGPDGEYEIALPPGSDALGLTVWAPGFIPVSADAWAFTGGQQKVRRGTFELSDACLIPAAYVIAQVLPPPLLPDEQLREEMDRPTEGLSFNSGVQFSPSKNWKRKPPLLNPTKDEPWKLECSASWNKVNSQFLVLVPPEVEYTVWTSNYLEPSVRCPSWKDLPALAPGERVTLPPKAAELNRPFIIRVVDSDGKGAAGLAVRINGRMPLISDQNGEVTSWSSGYIERIEVMPEKGWDVLAKLEKVTLAADEAAARVEIRLPQRVK